MVSHFLVLAFGGSFENLKTSGRMCLQGLGSRCRVWMVSHFLVLAFGGSFENLKTSGRMRLQVLGFSCRVLMVSHILGFGLRWQLRKLENLRTHVPAGFRV